MAMKVRKGNGKLGEQAKVQITSETSYQSEIPISSIVIKPWLKELIRPRTESEQANLKADIEANGLSTPITIATIDGEDNCLVDGHGRLESYQQLGKIAIPFTVKTFKDNDEIEAWVYRKQLGRRNLTKQDRAYVIGSLKDSKAKIARELEIGTTQVADARNYYKALNWLVENQDKNKDKLLKLSISSVINQHKKATERIKCTESVQVKKAVNWKLDESLVVRLKKFAKVNKVKSVSQQVERIIREHLDNYAN